MEEHITGVSREDRPNAAHERDQTVNAAVEVPLGVRVAAAWSWRLILIGIALAALVWLVSQVAIIVIPVIVALLLSALLYPIVHIFERKGWQRWLGVLTAMVTFLIAVTALVWLIVSQLRSGFGDVARKSTQAWHDILLWGESAFGLSPEDVNAFFEQIMKTINDNQGQIWSGALSATISVGQIVAGTLLTLFSLIFLLIDGKRIWYWVLGFFPQRAHAPADAAGKNGWVSVGQYVRVQVLVAFIDAVGIGLGAVLLGVPLPIPIAILVFIGSFIPFLGAISTGALAVFIALVYNGPLNALIMLSVVILVNQIEGHVLQPLVMGSAVKVHPLGVVLAVSTGALLAGVPGALFAVPLTAAASSMVNTLVERRWDPDQDPVAAYHKKNRVYREARNRARTTARMSGGGENA